MKRVTTAEILVSMGVALRELQYEMDVFDAGHIQGSAENPTAVMFEFERLVVAGLEETAKMIFDLGRFVPLPLTLESVRQLHQWYVNARDEGYQTPTWNELRGHIDNAQRDVSGVVHRELPAANLWFIEDNGDFNASQMLDRGPHLTEEQSKALPQAIRQDIHEAGKSLVVRTSTAVAFHLFRALETTTLLYFPLLGLTRQEKGKGGGGVRRDWNSYIEAIGGRDKNGNRITGDPVTPLVTNLLHHIREKYRNPITHDEETVFFTPDQASDFASLAMSALRMMTDDIIARRKAKGI